MSSSSGSSEPGASRLDVVIACSLGVDNESGEPLLTGRESLGTRPSPSFDWLLSVVDEHLPSDATRTIINYGPEDILSAQSSHNFVGNQALRLLNRLQERRNWDQLARDPIIFIGHELGGTIIKHAITLAALNREKYQGICMSTRLFVFLDCLHRAATPWETVNWVAQWLPPATGTRSPFLLRTIKALAATIDDVNELFLETKFLQLAKVVTIHSGGVGRLPTDLDEFSCSLGNLHERRIRLISDEDREKNKETIFECISGDSRAIIPPIQREWMHAISHLSALTKPVIHQTWLKDDTLDWRLNVEDSVYLKWRETRGPSALQLCGPIASHALRQLHRDATKDAATEDRLFLHFTFDRYDIRRNSARAMATSLVAQILAASIPSSEHRPLFQQRPPFHAWSLHDSLYMLARLIYDLDIVCTLENLDQCDESSRRRFLDVFENSILLTENKFKLLASTQDVIAGWPGESLILPLNGPSDIASGRSTDLHGTDDTRDAAALPEANQGDDSDEREGKVSSPHSANGLMGDVRKHFEILAMESNASNPRAQYYLDLLFGHPDTAFRNALVAQLFSTGSIALLDRFRHVKTPFTPGSFFLDSLNQIPDPDRDLVRRVMAWVLFAARPLSIQELGTIVFWTQRRELPDKSTLTKGFALSILASIIDLLWGFLVVDDNEVRASHPAVKDLFQGPGSDWFRIGHDAHHQIVVLCLELLELPDFVSSEEVNKGTEPGFGLGLPQVTFEDRSSLHHYVIMNWSKHYKQIPAPERPRQEVEKFFRETQSASAWKRWAVRKWALANPLTRVNQLETCDSPLPLLAELGDVDLLRHWTEQTGDSSLVAQGLALAAAARKGHKDAVEYLLTLGDSHPQASDLERALLAAASSGESEVLLLLITSAPDGFPWPRSLLPRASELGFEECVGALLTRGCSPNLLDGLSNSSPLLEAARNGRSSICNLLLEYGAELEVAGSRSVLAAAASCANGGEVIKILAGRELNVMDMDKEDEEESPFVECCRLGHFKVAEALADAVRQSAITLSSSRIRDYLRVAARGQFVRTMEPVLDMLILIPEADGGGGGGKSVMDELLVEAVDGGRLEFARLLLKRGADANTQGGLGTHPLLGACSQPNVNMDLVKLLVEHGADLEPPGEEQTPLELAAKNGQLACLEYLIKRGARVNRAQDFGLSSLALTARRGHLDCVKCLLDNGAEIDWRDEFGESAVFEAAVYDHYDIVDFLLEKGASASGQGWRGRSLVQLCLPCPATMRKVLERWPETDQKDEMGLTPLHYAAQGNRADAIKVLLEFKAEVDIEGPSTQDHHTPLIKAAMSRAQESVRALIEGGADVHHKALPWSCTALHHARDAAVVGVLLEYGPDVNAELKDGVTPLYFECTAAKPDLAVIQKLVNARANIDAQSKLGMTALMALADKGNQWPIMEYLLSKGADPNKASRRRGTALASACQSGNLQLVKQLHAAGARPDVPLPGFSRTPLQAACVGPEVDQDALDIIRYLVLEFNADVNQICGLFGTAVATACLRSTPDALNLLLEYHADPNIPDHAGRLPVHLAALMSPANLQVLVKLGCDLSSVDKTGRTILQWAAQSGLVEVVRLVLSFPGIEVDQADEDGWTALCWAARGVTSAHDSLVGAARTVPGGQAEIVQLLLDQGADRSVLCRGESDQEWTPLQVAKFHDQDRKITELLVAEHSAGAKTRKPSLHSAGSSGRKGRGHDGAYCDFCLSAVYGIRHECRTCDLDLDCCFKCYFHREKMHDPSHEFDHFGPAFDETSVVEDDIPDAADESDDAASDSSIETVGV